MKTKELIRQLQEIDPSGDEECCIGNADIHFVDKLPAYYDGTLQILKRDDEGNIIGGEFKKYGSKIVIRDYSLYGWILDEIESEDDTERVRNAIIIHPKDEYRKEQIKNAILDALNNQKEYYFNKFSAWILNKFDYSFKVPDENHKIIRGFYLNYEKIINRKDFNSLKTSWNDKYDKWLSDCIHIKIENNIITELNYIEGFEKKNYNDSE